MALGTGPLGYGDPDEATEPPDGAVYLSPWVSPATKSYEIDPVTGALGEVSPVMGRVIYCLTQVLGSSALLPGDGVKYPKKVDGQFEKNLLNAVRDALRQLTDTEKLIRIENIVVEKAGPRSQYFLHFFDLTTGRPESVRFR